MYSKAGLVGLEFVLLCPRNKVNKLLTTRLCENVTFIHYDQLQHFENIGLRNKLQIVLLLTYPFHFGCAELLFFFVLFAIPLIAFSYCHSVFFSIIYLFMFVLSLITGFISTLAVEFYKTKIQWVGNKVKVTDHIS